MPPAEDPSTKTSSGGGAAVNLPLVEAAAARLPETYEPLLLTFYRAPLEVVEGAVVIGTDPAAAPRGHGCRRDFRSRPMVVADSRTD